MRLVHLSDIHFGAITEGRPEALRAAVLEAAPTLTVVSGDLSQKGTVRELQEAKAFLDTLPQPQLIIPGNHDMPHGIHLWERFHHPWAGWRKAVSSMLEPVWKNEEMILVGMNSGRPGGWYMDWSRGKLSGRQLISMRKHFLEADPKLLRVLVVHHPPAPPPGGTARHLIDKRPALIGALNMAGVDMILSGHFHQSYALTMELTGPQIRDCVLSVASTATSYRLQGEPNGFHVIDCTQDRITVQPHTWDGARFAPAECWRFERDPGRNWKHAHDSPPAAV